ncbi:MAG TPA: PIN domain nuclease [Acidimicrobiia bacterium]
MRPGFTFDTGGLLALERRDRRVLALLARAAERQAQITVPAAALAQAVRRPVSQVPLMRLLRQPTTTTVALDRLDALRVGQLLAASGTSDIADAHVVVCAQRAAQPVVTSDPANLLRLDPGLELVSV